MNIMYDKKKEKREQPKMHLELSAAALGVTYEEINRIIKEKDIAKAAKITGIENKEEAFSVAQMKALHRL